MKSIAAIVFMFAAGLSQAADIWRWVDEHGRTHMADSVPERYKAAATKIESQKFQLSESERAAAAARAAKDRERLAAIETQRSRAEAAQLPASSPVSAASSPGGQSSTDKPETECDALWRTYHDSQRCFAPHLFPRGIKAEAFQQCKIVLSPSQRCGPAKNIGG
ncbi:DUF4124 domain-containing protein [Polaromonas sp.]|uniref:DUF4124 domain-containing protein n=1 Tax=Polaromonas sp. TaxID=1869339 RepID=UPI0032678154